jgi:hypothetical protein
MPKHIKAEAQPDVLKGWQQIAAFLSQPVSVAQRWATEGMPVKHEGCRIVPCGVKPLARKRISRRARSNRYCRKRLGRRTETRSILRSEAKPESTREKESGVEISSQRASLTEVKLLAIQLPVPIQRSLLDFLLIQQQIERGHDRVRSLPQLLG